MKTNISELNVVLFPQKNGDRQVWVAQCVSMDFAAQGATIEEAQANFTGTLDTHIALCLKHGETPFQNVPPAPAWFQRDFEMMESESESQTIGEQTNKRRMIFKHAMAA
jgi:predicted RNase H-like HicB family nuclease